VLGARGPTACHAAVRVLAPAVLGADTSSRVPPSPSQVLRFLILVDDVPGLFTWGMLPNVTGVTQTSSGVGFTNPTFSGSKKMSESAFVIRMSLFCSILIPLCSYSGEDRTGVALRYF